MFESRLIADRKTDLVVKSCSTRWPPVILAYEALLSKVVRNCGISLGPTSGCARYDKTGQRPTSTWYWRDARIAPGVVWFALAVLLKVANASLLGAKTKLRKSTLALQIHLRWYDTYQWHFQRLSDSQSLGICRDRRWKWLDFWQGERHRELSIDLNSDLLLARKNKGYRKPLSPLMELSKKNLLGTAMTTTHNNNQQAPVWEGTVRSQWICKTA